MVVPLGLQRIFFRHGLSGYWQGFPPFRPGSSAQLPWHACSRWDGLVSRRREGRLRGVIIISIRCCGGWVKLREIFEMLHALQKLEGTSITVPCTPPGVQRIPQRWTNIPKAHLTWICSCEWKNGNCLHPYLVTCGASPCSLYWPTRCHQKSHAQALVVCCLLAPASFQMKKWLTPSSLM